MRTKKKERKKKRKRKKKKPAEEYYVLYFTYVITSLDIGQGFTPYENQKKGGGE